MKPSSTMNPGIKEIDSPYTTRLKQPDNSGKGWGDLLVVNKCYRYDWQVHFVKVVQNADQFSLVHQRPIKYR